MSRVHSHFSKSGIFREYFRKHPELLEHSSNQKIYEMFALDHPDTPLTNELKNVCANVKSQERKRRRTEMLLANGRLPYDIRLGNRFTPMVYVTPPPDDANGTSSPSMGRSQRLEWLEDQIDMCIAVAKQLDRESLDEVIRVLRKARALLSAEFDAK